MVRLQPNRLSERVLSEQGANQLGADVLRTSDYRIADGWSEAGVWEPYTVPEIKGAEEVSLNGGDFTRTHNATYSIAYNTNEVSPEEAPTSWKDLVEGPWAGNIGITQGNSGGGVAALNRFMETELGKDYMEKYAAMKPTIFEGVGPLMTEMARGEVAVGTGAPATINLAVLADKAPLNIVIPEEGFIAFDYYLGITRSAKNHEAAEIFMNYNMSKRGQNIFSKLGDYAVDPEVDPPTSVGITLPRIDSGKVWRMSVADAKYGEQDTATWMEAFGR